MKKKFLCLTLAFTMVFGMSVGVAAAGKLEQISAYLNYGITIKKDGQTQTMYTANGKRIYPISYEGTTYVPLRAVSNMLGVNVEWDGANNTVLLGETNVSKDFINDLKPYSATWGNTATDISKKYFPTTANKPVTITGKTYDHYLRIFTNDTLYYDLGGKYDTLTFQTYTDYSIGDTPIKIVCVGDNGRVLSDVDVTQNALPKTVTVNVSGVQQLMIQSNRPDASTGAGPVYLFNATIE